MENADLHNIIEENEKSRERESDGGRKNPYNEKDNRELVHGIVQRHWMWSVQCGNCFIFQKKLRYY